MCPACEGLGQASEIDIDEVLDRSLSLRDGAIRVPGYTPDGWMVKGYSESGFFPPDKPIAQFTATQLNDLLYK